MHGSAQPDDPLLSENSRDAIAGKDSPASEVTGNPSAGRALEEPELEAALQLLVERTQYITGATGTALALPQGEEMVCCASAGSSAPAVGARLQVRSGLTGESISRRQLLRCDNAETDPRVNLETCRAMGVASIVVLPLLKRSGEIRGLFELFSDHPYAFEERDLIALERMADLTLTALDLAEQRQGSAPAPARVREPARPAETPEPAPEEDGSSTSEAAAPSPPAAELNEVAELSEKLDPEKDEKKDEPAILTAETPAMPLPAEAARLEDAPSAPVPEAMRRVQKCASCGFPVSEGRTLCLDCERKDSERKDREKKDSEKKQGTPSPSAEPMPPEFVPAFLDSPLPQDESWLANHVNLLAIMVLILGILVAVVVFR